jgi:stress response protein YsnF
MKNFKEGDIELTERGEQAVVTKQARVVEEVSVGKNVQERDQVVSDTVRRTDVDVQEINTNKSTRTDTETRTDTDRNKH